MGNSVRHGHGVPKVLNLDTGKITAQYHVILDDWFQTVDSTVMNQPNFDHKDWYRTFGYTEWQYIPDDPPELQDTRMPELEGAIARETLRRRREELEGDQRHHSQSSFTPGMKTNRPPPQREQSLQRKKESTPLGATMSNDSPPRNSGVRSLPPISKSEAYSKGEASQPPQPPVTLQREKLGCLDCA